MWGKKQKHILISKKRKKKSLCENGTYFYNFYKIIKTNKNEEKQKCYQIDRKCRLNWVIGSNLLEPNPSLIAISLHDRYCI